MATAGGAVYRSALGLIETKGVVGSTEAVVRLLEAPV